MALAGLEVGKKLSGMSRKFDASVSHRSVQSQLQTKNVPGIWHMPSYSLISWVPKTGKNKKFQL